MQEKKFDFNVRSVIVRGEASNKGVVAIEAANQHQMNRVIGFLDDGSKIVVAQRPGRGGMDFNKLLGGKVYAVAADGFSPVYEKDAEGKVTKKQKVEDGLPLYSASGFYSLSSKEYPGLDMTSCYTYLDDKGDRLLMLTDEQLSAKKLVEVSSDMDLDILVSALEEALGDAHNMVARHDTAMNKKRQRGVSRAKEEADDNGQDYNGVEFTELAVSKKDGNPFIMYSIQLPNGEVLTGHILREAMVDGEKMPIMAYFSAQEALERWKNSAHFKALQDVADNFEEAKVAFVQGHVMRTSVSFRRKYENVANAPADKPQYGDAVYIKASEGAWTKGIVVVIHSMHPHFPNADYDAHHYVVAPRQAEIGMNKVGEKWTGPQGIRYLLKLI